jgi:CelD/BcsL family acetyltransferase involved in cellulose biosynthesis
MSGWERLEGLEPARESWEGLARTSGNIFATWEWASTWWRHFGGDDEELALLRWRSGDEDLALAPLYRHRRGPAHVLRFLGHGAADVLGPICAPDRRAEAAQLLLEALDQGAAGSWGVLLAERIPTGPLAEALGGTVLHRESCPELAVEGRSWDDFVASCSKNIREKLRRSTRKIEKDHQLTYRLHTDPAGIDAAMTTLFDLHRRRWKEGEGEETTFQTAELVAFHRDFAALALDRGWLRLWTMEIDGTPVAAWYGYRFEGTEFYFQSGRDPGYDRFSVGFLMLMRTMQGAFEDGLATYSFLRGDEPYKGRFAELGDDLETRAVAHGGLMTVGTRIGAAGLEWPWLRERVSAAMR